ncbi:MAG: hypothetical protein Kapaf2KO_22640 [Candidatus Kapaibacteriales bacterium]
MKTERNTDGMSAAQSKRLKLSLSSTLREPFVNDAKRCSRSAAKHAEHIIKKYLRGELIENTALSQQMTTAN